jgi:hypothetical protein
MLQTVVHSLGSLHKVPKESFVGDGIDYKVSGVVALEKYIQSGKYVITPGILIGGV